MFGFFKIKQVASCFEVAAWNVFRTIYEMIIASCGNIFNGRHILFSAQRHKMDCMLIRSVHSVDIWANGGCCRIRSWYNTPLLIQLLYLKRNSKDTDIKPLGHSECCMTRQENEEVHTHQLFSPSLLRFITTNWHFHWYEISLRS